jgi:hypothetical protein
MPLPSHAATDLRENFESFNLGNLAGQNGWSIEFENNSTAGTIVVGTGANTSKVVSTSVSTASPAGAVRLKAIVGASSLTGTEVDAAIQFDSGAPSGIPQAQLPTSVSRTATPTQPSLRVSKSVSRMTYSLPTTPQGGGNGQFRTALAAGNHDDWYSYRMVFNLNTSQADYYYKNLTRGDSDFTFVLTRNVGFGNLTSAPSTWNEFSIVVPEGTFIDNLVFATEVAAIPEPGPGIMGSLGLLTMLGIRRRNKR